MRRRAALCAAVLALAGCGAQAPRHVAETAADPRALAVVTEAKPQELSVGPLPAKPWAGTVSHHLLAASLIDGWYAALARQGRYRLFVVLSPKHSRQGGERIELSEWDWEGGNGILHADRGIVRRLASALAVALDPPAFYGEHGIGTQVPFLIKHFPGSRIVPILLEEQARSSAELSRLADALEPLFRRRNDAFLLVSTDFSHHADREKLALWDGRSARFFEAVSLESAPTVGCDSRAGIFVLTLLAERLGRTHATVLAHSDSGSLSGVEEDMTSYFFTLLW